MPFNFVDIIVVLMIVYGAWHGWKYGGVSAAINLVGSILVFVLAYYLKNPISEYMYTHWKFISFGGIFAGISVFNILFYEALAYLSCVVVLSIALKVILKLTGIVDKILNMSVMVSLPFKILGLVCGAFQMFIYAFVMLFIIAQIPFSSKYFNESFLGDKIVSHTPVLSQITNNLYNSASEVYEICFEHQDMDDKTNVNLLSLAVLMKYDIITVDGVNTLVDQGKLKIDGLDEFLAEWEEDGDSAYEVISQELITEMEKAMEESGITNSEVTEDTTTAVAA